MDISAAQVTVVEHSRPRKRRLSARGFRAVDDLDQIPTSASLFDMVALLNVLDRCDSPDSLLETSLRHVSPGGLLLVAIVLPFCDMVKEGQRGQVAAGRAPHNPLRIYKKAKCNAKPPASFELAAAAFVAAAVHAHSLEVLSWTRLPYLASGDRKHQWFSLDSALFLLRRRSTKLPTEAHELNVLGAMQMHEHVHELPAVCEGRQRSSIFSWLEETLAKTDLQSWGHILDAGSGLNSLCWLMRQSHHSITAVTAESTGMYGGSVLEKTALGVDLQVDVLMGNWQDEELLSGKTFDVVVADYLLGAVDRYWAYAEDEMMARLLSSVRLGGFLLFVGLEPYEIVLNPKDSEDALILEVEALGDVACNLAGHRSYRELPRDWVVRHILRSDEFRLVASQEFPMTLRKSFLDSQLSFALAEAKQIDDAGVRHALMTRVKKLQKSASTFVQHERAKNYAIVAQRIARQ
eukprot:TRINITY_DN38696_c0_g1_i1.p1 TRINITY_DN38696_c0_g1~~TRINITY_DN38696_c0_g1_i1.p1  ORF type:complete len:487 (-),score=73.62 TRINITY_DN38696_c0_g1_i1:6-1394(-)